MVIPYQRAYRGSGRAPPGCCHRRTGSLERGPRCPLEGNDSSNCRTSNHVLCASAGNDRTFGEGLLGIFYNGLDTHLREWSS